jgi:hypothetical protein
MLLAPYVATTRCILFEACPTLASVKRHQRPHQMQNAQRHHAGTVDGVIRIGMGSMNTPTTPTATAARASTERTALAA